MRNSTAARSSEAAAAAPKEKRKIHIGRNNQKEKKSIKEGEEEQLNEEDKSGRGERAPHNNTAPDQDQKRRVKSSCIPGRFPSPVTRVHRRGKLRRWYSRTLRSWFVQFATPLPASKCALRCSAQATDGVSNGKEAEKNEPHRGEEHEY